MALAVIDYAKLVQFTDDLGFPKYTKVKLEVGGIGHQYYDKFIRENVQWVNHVDLDLTRHVRITESAQLVGELPESWALRHQQYLEGTSESNSFQTIGADIDGEFVEIGSHVNRNAIRITVGSAELKYKVDYKLDQDRNVINDNHLAVAVFDNAIDTSISYTTDLPVDLIWTTKVELIPNDNESLVPQLFKRVYYNDPEREESYPWVYVGRLTTDEYEIWREHNTKDQFTLADIGKMDFRSITEPVPADLLKSTGLKIAHLAS